MEENLICQYCGKLCKNENSLRNHERLCPENPNRQQSSWIKFNKERGAWNKGLTKESDDRIRKYGKSFSAKYKGTELGKKILGRPHTEEYKQKMREIAFKRGIGGWHTSKSYEYNGVKLGSEYELRVAKELDANGVSWTRPSYFLWEDDNSVKHRYYPDFYLPEYGVYLDPKNDYLINNKTARFGITDTEKIQRVKDQNGIQILILDKDHLTWKSIRENLTRSGGVVSLKGSYPLDPGSSPAHL